MAPEGFGVTLAAILVTAIALGLLTRPAPPPGRSR